LTGPAVAKLASWKEQRLPEALETSLPGVFCRRDCRSGTTKRVAFAIGDGALAVTCVHNLLGTLGRSTADVLNETSADRSTSRIDAIDLWAISPARVPVGFWRVIVVWIQE